MSPVDPKWAKLLFDHAGHFYRIGNTDKVYCFSSMLQYLMGTLIVDKFLWN